MDIKYCRVPEMIRGLTAKMNNEKSEWLPLWIHSTDTCGVAQLLLKEWMSETARRSLAGGMTDEAVNTLVCVTAFLHDIGKATALFQTRITKNCMPLRDNLKRAGLEALKESQIQLLTGRPFPHAAAGEAMLLMEGCPCSVAEVIGAHHGQPWSEGRMLEDELQADGTWLDVRSASLWGSEEQKEAWRAVQKECIRWMLSACGQDSLRTLPEISQTTAVLLTGLIIIRVNFRVDSSRELESHVL